MDRQRGKACRKRDIFMLSSIISLILYCSIVQYLCTRLLDPNIAAIIIIPFLKERGIIYVNTLNRIRFHGRFAVDVLIVKNSRDPIQNDLVGRKRSSSDTS